MSSPFVQAMVAAAAAARLPGSGIAWLDAARRESLDAFAAAGLPPARGVEAWKYTALRTLEQRRYALGDAQAGARAVAPETWTLPGVDGPRMVFVNGTFRADLSALDALPAGLTLVPLSRALAEDAEPLRFFLTRMFRASGDAFARLNAALAADGAVLRVAAGARIAAPVHIVHVGAPTEAEIAWHARCLVELGEGAELSLVEHHAAAGAAPHFGNLLSDVVLRDRARLALTVLQDADAGATLFRRAEMRLGADATATLHALELGGALVRHEVHASLDGDRARFDTRGVFALRGRQHVDTRLSVEHRGRDTAGDALWRGIADERARGVFQGAIVVAPGADGADAKLSNKNLLLSPQAEIDTKPVLEIYADEVKAAHGATVGQLDERSLFYLRSRGIGAAEARSLLTYAFCRAALDSLSNAALAEHLGTRLLARLPIRGED
ncbi:MAG: Fe-S cluster assembly protein SufD [Mizugakiibacter sp.]|uniref:Fe-S cluster assembly protein SufD n=1 Tax=Mizugakiibacter sp. TaxID=1972610 RepID=UPI0031BE923C|nr:Fe-S cluster assembly protein SufD [Xanthomonadaceae bacterium]